MIRFLNAIIRFNPHFRKGSDEYCFAKYCEVSGFNPHFRKGSDKLQAGLISPEFDVSIHTSAREVTNFSCTSSNAFSVSIHTSAREVTVIALYCFWLFLVSIHTSAREVTLCLIPTAVRSDVSIHTSAREVTKIKRNQITNVKRFNPHFRKGSDSAQRCLY